MSFDERYRLLELVGDEGAKTFVAEEIATGKKVTVFLFVGEQAKTQRGFFLQLRELDRMRFTDLIETGDNRGTPYAVTGPGLSFAALKERVEAFMAEARKSFSPEEAKYTRAGVWHVPPDLKKPEKQHTGYPQEIRTTGQPSTQSASAQPEPLSFTQLFQAASPPPAKQTPEEPPAHEKQVGHASPPPGEFTQMFQATAAPAAEPGLAGPESQSSPQHSMPGEFTQMFQAASAPMAEPQTATPLSEPLGQASSSPGEFTRMFQAAAPIGEAAPQPPVSEPIKPLPQKDPTPGEFTRFFGAKAPATASEFSTSPGPQSQGEFESLFGKGESVLSAPAPSGTGIFNQPVPTTQQNVGPAPGMPPPAESAFRSPGEFTKIFGGVPTDPQTSGSPPTPQPVTTPPVSTPSSPGEYTLMFGAQTISSEPSPEPPPTPAPPPQTGAAAPKPSLMVPICIILGLLLLATIAVVLIVTSK